MAVNYNPKIITDNLVLCVDAANTKSYGGSGTTWTDLSGKGNNGTIINATFNSDGYFAFDGSGDYVTTGNTLPDADELFADTGTAWSVSSWFNVAFINFFDKAVTGRGGGIGAAAVYAVWVDQANLRVRLRGGTITNISTSIADDTWYNVAVTWDGSTARGYLNGQFITTLAVGTASNQTETFTIGATDGGAQTGMIGGISQTLAYNRALTASEVAQNFNALRGRFGI